MELAEKNPVGKARDQPNHSPTLPQPEGRIQLSLNPFDMYKQMIGPEMRAKICRWILLLCCIALCVAVGPTIVGSLISTLIANGLGFSSKPAVNPTATAAGAPN